MDSETSSLGSEKPPSGFWLTAQTNVRRRHQAPAIKSVPRDVNLSLSFNQERLWSIDRLEPNSSIHNLLHLFQFEGPLDIPTLVRCLREIAQRHEILRTVFSSTGEQPIQIVSPDVDFELSVEDPQIYHPNEWEKEVRQFALAFANQPFNLTNGLLWRFKLLRLSPERHVLIRVIHHIIFDGWSNSVFMRELEALYKDFLAGEPSPLGPLPIQYADFANAQRQWFQENLFSSQVEYWTDRFEGGVSALALPIDNPRSMGQSNQGECQSLKISEGLTRELKAFSYRQGVSLFVVLLAIWKTLLYCYTQQEDMMVCSPVASRHRNETKGLIGYFNNVIVMRTDLSENPSLRELFQRVSAVTLGAYANQDVPLQKVVALPSLVRTPLTRSMFTFQNIPNQSIQMNELKVSSEYVERESTNFDLSLSLQEVDGQLEGILQYKTDLFETNSIAQMLSRFQNLLEVVTANPDLCLSDLPTFEAVGNYQLASLNDTSADTSFAAQESYALPLDEFEQKLTQIWEEVLEFRPIGRTHNFFELGGHSLLAVQLFSQIERVFGRTLSLSTLLQSPTIEQLANLLRQEECTNAWHSLVPIQPNGSRPPLFCMHGGGLNILIFRELSDALGPDQPLYGLQAKGLDGNAEPHFRIEDMATDYIHEMRTVQPHGPYFLAGLSNGGVIGLEIAQQLNRQGESIGLVAMFDTYGPDKRRVLLPLSRVGSILIYGLRYSLPRFVKKLKAIGISAVLVQLWEKRSAPAKTPDSLIEDESIENGPIIDGAIDIPVRKRFFEGWVDKLHLFVLQHSPMAFHAPSLAMPESQGIMFFNLRRLEKAHHQARIQYKPRPYTGCITIFRATEQPPGFYRDRNFGWSEIAKGGLEIYDVPGHHSSITQSNILAQKLKDCLDGTQPPLKPFIPQSSVATLPQKVPTTVA
jgi:thioesterase domain-containing protein/acyl carrier protein/NRPS condensation-like uncharacterized protein